MAAMVIRKQRAILFASGRVVVGGRDWKRDSVAVGLLGDLKWVVGLGVTFILPIGERPSVKKVV